MGHRQHPNLEHTKDSPEWAKVYGEYLKMYSFQKISDINEIAPAKPRKITNSHTSQEICFEFCCCLSWIVNTMRLRQNGCHFPDNIFKCNFFNENIWITIQILLKFVLKCPMNNNPALVQIMPWRQPGNKPLSEPMMTRLPMHICVNRLTHWGRVTHICVVDQPSLVPIMACRLDGAKPLSKPMLGYC